MPKTNTKLSKEAQELQAQVANSLLIGAQTYWENRSGVTRQELRDAAADQGLEIVVPDPKPEGTFRGVMKAVAQYDKSLVARETRNDDVLTYAIARVDANDASKVGDQTGEIVNRVLWRKVEIPGQPRFAFKVEDDVATALAARYDHLMRYMTADEVREAVGATVKGIGGIKMLGRMWFVGLAQYDQLVKVKAMIQAVGMVCHIIPVLDLGDSRESMAHNAERQVWNDLKELRAEVDQWIAGTRSPRKSTLEARLATFRSLRDGVENMADVLQLQANELRTELETMKAAAMRLLDPDAAGPEDTATQQANEAQQDAAQQASTEPAAQVPTPDASDASADSGQDSAPAATAPKPPARPQAPGGNGSSDKGLDGLTVKELRKMVKAKGLRPGKMTRAALIGALAEMDQ